MSTPVGNYTRSLILIAIAFCVAGCASKDDVTAADTNRLAFDDLRAEVRDVIDDPAREEEAVALVTALESDLNALYDKMADRGKRLRELNADYESTRANFEAYLNDVTRDLQSNQQQIRVIHTGLRDVTTAEEWDAISKARTKAMSGAVRSIKRI